MPAPPAQRALALDEALNFCAVPNCFVERGLDVHHVNQVRTDHRLDNLIALCPTHHLAWCHRGPFAGRLATSDLLGYKAALTELVPGRMRTGAEVLAKLASHYERGQFAELERGVFIQFKALRRDSARAQDAPLVAKLNEYLGEVAILNGAPADASRFLRRAVKLATWNASPEWLSHCLGLVALDRVNWMEFRSAIDYLDEAVALLDAADIDESLQTRQLGWLNHLRVSVYRHTGDADAALRHVELADMYYAQAEGDLLSRETADRALVRAMALSVGDDVACLNKAHDILASVETLVHTQGWLPTRARLRLQKVRLLLKLQDNDSAATELVLAWKDAANARARQYVEESLRMVVQEPLLCREELLHMIANSHGPCAYCVPSDPRLLASCALRVLAVRDALDP